MILACPHCSAVYELPRHLLGPGGAAVRCPHCTGEFTLGADGEVVGAGVGATQAAEATAVSQRLAARAAGSAHDAGATRTAAAAHAPEAVSDAGASPAAEAPRAAETGAVAGRPAAARTPAPAASNPTRTPAPAASDPTRTPARAASDPTRTPAPAASEPTRTPAPAASEPARAPAPPGPEPARTTVSMRAPDAALGSAAARAAAAETTDRAEAGSDAQAIARRVLEELAARKGPAMADANARGRLLSEFGPELAAAFEQFRKESGGTGNPAPFREVLRERWGIDLTPPARG